MKQLKSTKIQKELIRKSLDESVSMILNIDESFTRKIRSKKNDELTAKADTAFVPDGVYILHETLGVRTVDSWNSENNNGVVGVLVVEDEHRIVVALEDAPEDLPWSKESELVNQPIEELEEAESDFNGEEHCIGLNSPDFPAAYYCKTYNKGGRSWYLPSYGELWMIYSHFDEIQNALSIVGGQKLITTWDEGDPVYWSSTERGAAVAWGLNLDVADIGWYYKVNARCKVRPVSKFGPSKTLKESFTRKIRSKKNDELTSKPSFELDNGVYILHETLGVKTVDGWNPKDNKGVVGILLIEDEHKIVVATEDSPDNLHWSKKCELVNQPIEILSKDAESDFNGEMYCQKLNSPDFPAAYYCLNYNKGNRDWYLPSSGELWLIRNHLEEVQTALSIVGGQKFVITWDDDVPVYWSSTESSATDAWDLYLYYGTLGGGGNKVRDIGKVRPVSKFGPASLKESFTRKIRSKKNDELTTKADTAFVPDGVYILHETLGVKTVDGWNPKNNDGVVGILLVEDEHKIVVALEDSPEVLPWSKESELVNQPVYQPVEGWEYAESDFNGEMYCRKLDSPDFPAAYYCKTYNKGNRDWYLPSIGELWMIYSHFDEIQNALSIVGGQKFVTTWDDDVPVYWSSTECSDTYTWSLYLNRSGWLDWDFKVSGSNKVRPVSKFGPSKTLKESFTKKISSKKNTDLVSEPSFILDNGVYILHETLGVRGVEGWNPKFNKGVVGALVVEDEHQLVVALEDSSNELCWSEENKLVNHPFENRGEAKSDFNGEEHCRKLNSPEYPAAYYCSNYNKGGRDWYLPSMGELWLIYRHLEEIQTALSIVGGQKFVTTWDDVPYYWSSTEYCATRACPLNLSDGYLGIGYKVSDSPKVRPVSKFDFSTLKESFTRKIRSKKNDELTSKPSFELDNGVYILHETLGVKDVEGWNPEDNKGVVGILLIEDEHKIVVALEDSPENLQWSKESGLSENQPVKELEDAESDFNGEYYCQKLDSPDFPAAYYCKTYNKGGRNWYLPSTGELWLIYNHLEEIQNALSIVGGQKFATKWNLWNEGVTEYWSSTEYNIPTAWFLNLTDGRLYGWNGKFHNSIKVRPVSKFDFSTLKESFTRKIRSKKNDELTSKADTAFVPDGVYILHDTLGLKGVEGWNPRNNYGVVGILLIEYDHKIVVALEDAPKTLTWSKKRELINQPVDELEDTVHDFNGEYYCRKLNSPDFPAAYYCKTYNKGGRKWYLPSTGELWLIYNHLEEIQNALSIVRGQKLVTTWDEGVPVYWSSTEDSATNARDLYLDDGYLGWSDKVSSYSYKVRPVSAFHSSLKESFTRKIRSKKNDELTIKADTAFVPDGVYILHDTLGIKTVEGWNPKNNNGVVGVLVVEDEHKIVVATEDAPEDLPWSKKRELINQPVDELEDAESDFNGEYYCQKLDSPDFPAAYYCKTYNKGNRSWYLPSSGELRLIYRHLDEIQNALSIVGGQKLVTNWVEGIPTYWSSTEYSAWNARPLPLNTGSLHYWYDKVSNILKVRPVSAFSV